MVDHIDKKIKKQERAGKIVEANKYFKIAQAINGDFLYFRRFPKKYHVIRDKYAGRIYLEELDNQVLEITSELSITEEITKFCASLERDELHLTHKQSIAAMQYWSDVTPSMDVGDIAPVLQKDEPGYTYRRLDFNFRKEETPLFDELMSRTSNADAFMGWVGSLFDPVSDRQQYVWVNGMGENGKGSVAKVLTRALGDAACWTYVPDKDKFWTATLLGKRLVIFGDCNNYGFPSSGLFKSLTGGDVIKIEHKMKMPFNAELHCKFLFLSNDIPAISLGRADMRRIIFCEMAPIVGSTDLTYGEKLWGEAPGIFWKCIMKNAELIEAHGFVKTNNEEIENIAAQHEEWMEYLFSQQLQVAPSGYLSLNQLQRVFESADKTLDMGNVHRQRQFKKYLKEKHGVRRGRWREDGQRETVYLGVSKRPLKALD